MFLLFDIFLKKINFGYLMSSSVFKNFLGMVGIQKCLIMSIKCFEFFFEYFVFIVVEEIFIDLLFNLLQLDILIIVSYMNVR